ncbi:protein of unknown function [Methanoculleus bourgensis]|uniref:Uncharacterized protein n=1 Tax=Methanoculleus bourgensis TaxID=83986 RepID=A0A0X3BNG8_9EURY|nr:protein of unknown function [Methanoculleus bourgensis]
MVNAPVAREGCVKQHTNYTEGLTWTRSGLQLWASGTVPVHYSRELNTTGGAMRPVQPG